MSSRGCRATGSTPRPTGPRSTTRRRSRCPRSRGTTSTSRSRCPSRTWTAVHSAFGTNARQAGSCANPSVQPSACPPHRRSSTSSTRSPLGPSARSATPSRRRSATPMRQHGRSAIRTCRPWAIRSTAPRPATRPAISARSPRTRCPSASRRTSKPRCAR